MRVLIEGNKITAYIGTDKRPEVTITGLNTSAKPATIDIKREAAGKMPRRAIYQLEGDTLQICWGRRGAERPKDPHQGGPGCVPTGAQALQEVNERDGRPVEVATGRASSGRSRFNAQTDRCVPKMSKAGHSRCFSP
jgi:hypothetical protein